MGAAIFIFSYLVCYERCWLGCSAAGVNFRLRKTQSANVQPSSGWPAAEQKHAPLVDLYFMPMLAHTDLLPNANFGLTDWS